MKLGVVWFSCLRDVDFLRASMQSVKHAMRASGSAAMRAAARGINFYVAVHEDEIARWPELAGVTLLPTRCDRNGSLNGLPYCVEAVQLYSTIFELAPELTALLKLDSDVVQVGAKFVEKVILGDLAFFGYANAILPSHVSSSFEGDSSKVCYSFASGGAYYIARALVENFSVKPKDFLEHNVEICGGYLCGRWPEDETITSYLLARCEHLGLPFRVQLPELPHGYRFFRRWPYAGTKQSLPDPDAVSSLALTADFVEVREYDAISAFLPDHADQMQLAENVMVALAEQVKGLPEVSVQESRRIAVLVQGTGAYKKIAIKALESVVLKGWRESAVDLFLFTDKKPPQSVCGVPIHWVPVPHRPVPWVTHLRFHQMLRWARQVENNWLTGPYSHVVYLDADSCLAEEISGQEMFGTDLFATTHAFHDGSSGPAERNVVSQSYIPPEESWSYVCGAFYGGAWGPFLTIVERCALATSLDLSNGIIARWHDESMINHHLWRISQSGEFSLTRLHSGYCWQEFTKASHRFPKMIENSFHASAKKGRSWGKWLSRGARDGLAEAGELIARTIVEADDQTVFEVAAGDGEFQKYLHQAGFTGTYSGIDPTAYSSERRESILTRGLAQPLPLRTNSKDTVVMWNVLEHCPFYENLLFESLRVASRRVLVLYKRTHEGSSAMESLGDFVLACGARLSWQLIPQDPGAVLLEVKPNEETLLKK